MKLVPSKTQWNILRIMYATMLACKYHGLSSEKVFVKGVDPAYMRRKDALKWHMAEGFLLDKWDGSPCEVGLFKIRKTKKGVIVSMDLGRIKDTMSDSLKQITCIIKETEK